MNKFEINDVNLYYGDFHALKNIDLNIQMNEITAFIGPSGCGKSTLLKSLNRMNDLVENCRITGKFLLDGEDIYGDMDVNTLRKRVGMVFQKPNPFPMSIYDNIAFGPRTHGIRSRVKLDEIVEQSLRKAAIWDEVKDRLKKSALGMSGGQQQRLCIARALAVKPEVLLMDEPTSALDPISTSKIEDLAVELKKDYTIIMVTHNMQQAVRISDKTAFFLLGEIIEYSDTQTLFSTPAEKGLRTILQGGLDNMRNHFDEQLDKLNIELITMGSLCEEAISSSVKALLEDDTAFISKVRDLENEIDRKEREIEGLCMRLLLQQQPVACDLRMISSAMKMISDMERIGDQASDMAEIAVFVKNDAVKSRIHIHDMADAAVKMVTDSVESFVKKDTDLACQVIKDDDAVDDLFNMVKNEIVGLIASGDSSGESCIDLFMAAKYLERIGDHAVNIAERVVMSLANSPK